MKIKTYQEATDFLRPHQKGVGAMEWDALSERLEAVFNHDIFVSAYYIDVRGELLVTVVVHNLCDGQCGIVTGEEVEPRESGNVNVLKLTDRDFSQTETFIVEVGIFMQLINRLMVGFDAP